MASIVGQFRQSLRPRLLSHRGIVHKPPTIESAHSTCKHFYSMLFNFYWKFSVGVFQFSEYTLHCVLIQHFHSKAWFPLRLFAWDMCRVVKRTEQDEKISFALFTFEVQIFQRLRNFLAAKPIRFLCWATWTFNEDQQIFTKWRSPPPSFSRPTRRSTSVCSQNKNSWASN